MTYSHLILIRFGIRGHNELDEPAFTQPLMYDQIRSRRSVPTLYEEQLIVCLCLNTLSEVIRAHVDLSKPYRKKESLPPPPPLPFGPLINPTSTINFLP